MILSYLNIAFRNLVRQKGYALINILGLALGFACAILILLYTSYEWQVDRHHPDAERTFRILAEEESEGRVSFQTGVAGALGPALQSDFPEVERAVRVINPSYLTTWVYHENRGFQQQFCMADRSVMELFDIPLLVGDPTAALDKPNGVVITERTARQYFGAANPIGEMLRVEGFWGGEYEVTGVLRDVARHSTLRFDMLSGNVKSMFDSWQVSDWRPVNIYVKLAEGTKPEMLEQKMPEWIDGHTAAELTTRAAYHLQPLTRIYLYSAVDYGLNGQGDITIVRLLALIAGFVLLLAAINFINLTTARAMQRAKEVGIRKVVGAFQRQLIIQFLGEAILLSALALAIALILAQLALPTLNLFLGKTLSLTGGNASVATLAFLGFALFIGLVAGFYPALVLSAFRPITVLGSGVTSGSSGVRLRRLLVVIQFATTVVLLVSTGVVYQQWQYLSSQRWGFNKDEVVVLPIIQVDPAPMWSDNWLGWRQSALKQAFTMHPNVLSASVSHVVPPLSITTWLQAEGEVEPLRMQYIYADKDFLQTYEIDLLAGRNFGRELLSAPDLTDILINQTAVRQLGWTDPIGRQLEWESTGAKFTVIGVIKDFLNEDMSLPIQPLFLMQMAQPPQMLSLRLRLEKFQETLAFLEETWRQFLPTRPFQFEFVEEKLRRMYQNEVRLGQVIGVFAGFAVAIACLGLFGLAAYSADRRTKEIAIRKVLGATATNITALLSSEFMGLVLLANVLAWPVAYYGMTQYLENFAYRIDLDFGIFTIAGLITFMVALFTVSGQAVKAALANPVESLVRE